MDLQELDCLVAVADTGGVTRAAESLGVTQPAVSAALRRLEREVGERLVERAGRGIRLTAAGRAALGPARAALEAADDVRRAVADLSGLLRGEVRLGHVGSGAAGTVLDPLTRFHEAHPEVAVSLVEGTSDVLRAGLLEGSLDLAWVGQAGPLPAGLDGRVVVDERLVLGVSPDHPLAGRPGVELAEAVAHPLVALPEGTGARAAFDAGCAAHRLTPTIAFQCSAPDLVGRLAATGRAAAVVAEPLAVALGLVVVPLTRPAVRSRLVLAWAAGGPTSPAARAFLAAVAASAVGSREH